MNGYTYIHGDSRRDVYTPSPYSLLNDVITRRETRDIVFKAVRHTQILYGRIVLYIFFVQLRCASVLHPARSLAHSLHQLSSYRFRLFTSYSAFLFFPSTFLYPLIFSHSLYWIIFPRIISTHSPSLSPQINDTSTLPVTRIRLLFYPSHSYSIRSS